MASNKSKEFPAVEVTEGVWYALDNPEVMECCDCSLVHRTEFKLEGGRLFWRCRVDHKRTAIQRREHGIIVKRKR